MNMTNLLLFPILIPFLFAILLLFFKESVLMQRILVMTGLFFSTVSALYLVFVVKEDGIQTVTL